MVIIPINGRNERMRSLFKTPKHLLLYEGEPALKRSLDYMSAFDDEIIILAGEKYYNDIKIDWLPENCTVKKVKPTDNVIETLLHQEAGDGDLWIVDCDVVPLKLQEPKGNAVYCFNNSGGPNNYSNYMVVDGRIFEANEKGMKFTWAGAGVYYFQSHKHFNELAVNRKNVSDVVDLMIEQGVRADCNSQIYRLGTLPDITGGFTGNRIEHKIVKTGENTYLEAKWYETYEDKNDIPKVTAGLNELTLEYIHQDSLLNVYQVAEVIQKYRHYRPLNFLEFQVYRDRIAIHLLSNPGIANGEKLLEKLDRVVIPFSFSHGDLSTINIISTRKGLKLIDPLYSEDKFGSYVLDEAKFLFSLKFYANDIPNYNLFRSLIQDHPRIDVLIASECVRVATYNKKFNFIAENLIAEL